MEYEPISEERREALSAITAKARENAARPFRFEDLDGAPEPTQWGPVYPKTASPAVQKYRKLAHARPLTGDETHAHGHAVGEWIRVLQRREWRNAGLDEERELVVDARAPIDPRVAHVGTDQ